ncbi:hypothetical protein BpHYR1_044243 [Brachionus plicatilis]|uniref:Uncharacterized protein n=1 Tax=Brachionus plicatilis TaxID=10195 RepID=A0A3M7PIZ5_BRAPC|nr:hypothetical protein BpHYR1_044243 [Brachionus plicatilis]
MRKEEGGGSHTMWSSTSLKKSCITAINKKSSLIPSPASCKAFAISSAALESPSALITAACFDCSAFSTKNLAFSASCCATCLASTAFILEKIKLQLKCRQELDRIG